MQRIDPENLEDKLYSSREVAQILGVSLRTIYRYIESGKLLPETQTKSGRHLFGKKAIVGFLFPDTGYKGQDTGGSRKQEERDGKDRRVNEWLGDGKVEDKEEDKQKVEVPSEKGEIKFPLEKKTEEIKLTKEGAVAPRHERDILKELS